MDECIACSKNFDLEARTPKFLPNCGHTSCLKCLLEFSAAADGCSFCPQCLKWFPIRPTQLMTNVQIVSNIAQNTFSPGLVIYVKGIPLRTTSSDIKNFFMKYGTVTEVSLHKTDKVCIVKGREALNSYLYAFVTFEEPSTVQRLLKTKHLQYSETHELTMEKCRGKDQSNLRSQQTTSEFLMQQNIAINQHHEDKQAFHNRKKRCNNSGNNQRQNERPASHNRRKRTSNGGNNHRQKERQNNGRSLYAGADTGCCFII